MSGAAPGRTLALASVLIALCACVTPQEFHVLRRDVDQLKKGRGGAPAADEWARSSGGGATGAPVADLGAEVESLRDEVGRLQGQVEDLRTQLDAVRAGQSYAASAPRPGEGTAVPGAEGSPAAVVAPTPGAEGVSPGESAAPAEEIRDYEDAFRRYRAGEYPAAIDRFQVFLQTHPSSEYADNALFWMGESYFKQNDFEQAAVAFDKVVKRFPNGNKVPDALYRQGVSLLEIGNRNGQQKTYKPAACQVFRRITDEYPNSDRVPEARRQLEKCGS